MNKITNNSMFDIIGDIHGHADKLQTLLKKLGYEKKNGCYSHPERKALFVGDYIDRGPEIRETLKIVRSMTDNEKAIALMGNHEYNALCFHFQKKDGGHLRKHSIKNIIQHYATLQQFQNKQGEYEDYLEWFKTLPLFMETDKFRAVHACWDGAHINYFQLTLKNNRLTDDLIFESTKKSSALHHAIEETLKGKEMKMPDGLFFTDKDGTKRNEIRIKWWDNPSTATYRSISVEPIESLPQSAVHTSLLPNADYYKEDERPVFFGHYWLKGNPALYRNNICCLDYSVAKHGYLVAYQLDEELPLHDSKLIFV